MRKKASSKNGFTLVEVMLVVGIFTFIFAGVLGVLMGSQRCWSVAEAKVQANEQLRVALTKMAKELRHSSGSNISPPTLNILFFQVPIDADPPPDGDGKYDYDVNGNLIWGADNIQDARIVFMKYPDGRLVRNIQQPNGSLDPNQEELLVSNVTAANFTGHGTPLKYVTIELTMESNNVAVTKRTSVALKN